jgi:NHL repeat-containing protein
MKVMAAVLFAFLSLILTLRVPVAQAQQFAGWAGGCTSGSNCDVPNQHSQGFTCTTETCSGFTSGVGDGQFLNPNGIALDASGNIYIASNGTRVENLAMTGAFTGWAGKCTSGSNCDTANQHSNGFTCAATTCDGPFAGTGGDAQFLGPNGIAIDSLGNIYVADEDLTDNRVLKFASDGTFIGWAGRCGFGPNCDSVNQRSLGFSCTAMTCFNTGFPGNGDGQFYGPTGVAVDSLDNVYVVEFVNRRVQKFDPSGAFITKWGSLGSDDGQFNAPRSLAIDSSDFVYVADTNNYRVQKFDSAGTFLGWAGKCTAGSNCDIAAQHSNGFTCDASTCSGLDFGSGDGQFTNVWSVAVNDLGDVYVSESSRVQRFDSTGMFIGWAGRCLGGVGCDIANQRSNGFLCTAATCTGPLPGSGDGQFQDVTGIAADPSGNVYLSDSMNSRVQLFN